MFRASVVGGDVRQVHVGLLRAGKLDLGFLGGFFQTLHGQIVARQIDTAVRLELVDQIVDQRQVEIFTAQEGVAVGRQHFELRFAINVGDFDDGDIEGTATQVVHRDGFITTGFVHAVGKRCGGRLVDDALDVQTGNAARIFSSLTLAVVEVGRYGDDRFGDRFAEIVFGGLLHFLQHFRAYLRRCHFFAFHFYPRIAIIGFSDFVGHHLDVFLNDVVFEATADQTLDGVKGVFRVGHGLALGGLTYQGFAVVGVGNDGRRGTTAFGVFNDFSAVTIEHGHTRVSGAQVDTNNASHSKNLEFG